MRPRHDVVTVCHCEACGPARRFSTSSAATSTSAAAMWSSTLQPRRQPLRRAVRRPRAPPPRARTRAGSATSSLRTCGRDDVRARSPRAIHRRPPPASARIDSPGAEHERRIREHLRAAGSPRRRRRWCTATASRRDRGGARRHHRAGEQVRRHGGERHHDRVRVLDRGVGGAHRVQPPERCDQERVQRLEADRLAAPGRVAGGRDRTGDLRPLELVGEDRRRPPDRRLPEEQRRGARARRSRTGWTAR